MRNYAAEQQAREQRARDAGYIGYGQQRRYRQSARYILSENGLDLGRSRKDTADADKIARLMHESQTGGTGLTSAELHEEVATVYEDRGLDIVNEEGHDEIWILIRSFYPRKKG